MDRLTHRETPENTAYVDRGLVSLNWYSMTDEGYRGPAIDRLAAYEETGLEPEEVLDLAAMREITPEAEYAINKLAESLIERMDALIHKDDEELEKYRAIGGLAHLRELALAEKDGRLVVLPLDKIRWINAILAERERQDGKWGYPQENTYCEWASILTEEVGELAKEMNELNFGRGDAERMEAEAVQVAAVALSILEQSAVAYGVTVQTAVALGRMTRKEAEDA